MQRFPTFHGSGEDWRALCEDCVSFLGTLPAAANVGFLYITPPLAPPLDKILLTLKNTTGVLHWIGSVGIGVNCTAREYYDIPAMAVMIGEFPEEEFRIIPAIRSGPQAFAAARRPWYQRHPSHFGILHGDPRNPVTPYLLGQLAREVPETFFVGGLTSSTNLHYRQIADTATEGGISGLLFGPAVKVTTGLTQGCSPLGSPHRITACDLNIIHRIDDRPALDVLFEEVGEILSRDPQRIAGYIFAGLPIRGKDYNDYLVRNLIGLDLKSRRIAIGEHVSPGQSLLFCRRDGNSACEDMLRMLRNIRRRLPAPPRGGIYYSCLGRGRHLFGEDSQELRMIQAELGNIPLVGFFCHGEIFHNHLYGYTGVLTLFS
jgi:small ligand-binding sensory domain FIST